VGPLGRTDSQGENLPRRHPPFLLSSRSASTRRPRLSSPRCVAKLGDGAHGCGTLCFLSPSVFLSQPWRPPAHDAAPQLLVVRQWVIEVCTYTRAFLESRPARTSPGQPSITAVVATIIRDLGGGFVKITWIPHGLSHGRVHRREETPDDAGPHVSDTKLQVWVACVSAERGPRAVRYQRTGYNNRWACA
jgi:hypothetical protein